MNNQKGTISLKIKLLIILIGISISILLVYASMALDEFEKDKIAYVFDATKTHSKNVSTQLKSELEFAYDKVQFLMRGYNYTQQGGFHSYSKTNFNTEKKLVYIKTFKKSISDESFLQHSQLQKGSLNSTLSQDEQNALIKEAAHSKISIRLSKQNRENWLMALLFKTPNEKDTVIVIAEIAKGNFLETFTNNQLQDSFIVNTVGQILLSPQSPTYEKLNYNNLETSFKNIILNLKSPVGIFEKSVNDTKLLISIARVGLGELHIVSLIPKVKALEAVKRLIVKSIIFLLLLVTITVFISVLASSKLTSSLKKLLKATERVSKGDFDLNLDIKSNDEVELLSNGFNHMALEIQRLLEETAEKARMEGELQTAQLVQSTLFPANKYEDEHIGIDGYYKSASECGGDWWFYNKIGNKTILWIGDATGHGVPAALVTSAANSAANVMIQLADLHPHEMMAQLNRAIYNTAKGKVMMTFFIGIFDDTTQKFTYCCASHDPPFLLSRSDKKLKRKDIKPLMEDSGPRLGESLESTYKTADIDLGQGDRIIFYTDGVTELNNPEGDMLGERKFIKNLLNSFNSQENIATSMENLYNELSTFKGDAALEDDVTYFMFEYKEQSLTTH